MNSTQIKSRTQSESGARKQRFPFLDLQAEFATMQEEVLAAVKGVLESQHFIMGPEVGKLEAAIAKHLGCSFAISCASGSDALLLAMMALGVDGGDEVITVPFTFVATAGSIARLKATPVFVDIEPETYNLDWKQLEAAITPRTKAIIPVHLFGLPAEMEKITEIARAHRIPVIEDAAQAIGARYRDQYVGNLGVGGCLSFFPSKNLGGAGDGGMVTSNDPEFADRLSVLRLHGGRRKYHYDLLGMNSRLDTLQAAILLVKLRYLHDWTKARQRNADRYRDLFAQADLNQWVTLPVQPEGFEHVYNQFVIRVQRRDELREYLRLAGIPSEIYYPLPLHLQAAFTDLKYGVGAFPQAEAASQEVLAIPVFPTMTEQQQQTVVAVIGDFFAGRNQPQRSQGEMWKA
jgi:dTDP-4-amino-4,6-dideoxygalactose transaminase